MYIHIQPGWALGPAGSEYQAHLVRSYVYTYETYEITHERKTTTPTPNSRQLRKRVSHQFIPHKLLCGAWRSV